MGPVLAILLIACGSGAGSDIGLRDQAVDALDAADITEDPDVPADAVALPDVPEPPACDLATTGLRIEVSRDKPLFLFNLYGDASEVAALSALLPADVRSRFAIHYVPAEPYDFSEAWQAAVEAIATAADDAGMPLFLQVEHGNTRNAATGEYWHGMFDRHPSLTGLVFAEICWTGLWFDGLDDDYIARMIADLDVVAAHGGYLLWQDMATDNVVEVPHVFLKAGADPGLMAAFRAHGRNVIVQDKHNGSGKRFVNAAAPMGLWASCVIGNWGVHSEDWLWWEAGYTHLFQPSSGVSRSGPAWQSVMSFPDALFGIDWMAGLAGGATVFGVEIPAKLVSPDGQRLCPAFQKVLLPLIRRMLAEPLAPSRDQARSRMKVAYQPLEAPLQDLMQDGIFQGLYGPEEASLWEWLPSTGRYYYLPILPVLSTPGERALFDEVIDSARWTADLSDLAVRRAFFDARYPSTGDGDAWFVAFPGRLLAFNPRENKDLDANFTTAIDVPGLSLSATLPAHTSLLALSRDDGLEVDLSNYRIDSEADVWTDASINDDPMKYIRERYSVDPTDDARRTTVVRVEGLAAAATLEVSGDPRAVAKDVFSEGRHTVTVDHNGPVTLRFRWPVP
jgi:hypothetical protein